MDGNHHPLRWRHGEHGVLKMETHASWQPKMSRNDRKKIIIHYLSSPSSSVSVLIRVISGQFRNFAPFAPLRENLRLKLLLIRLHRTNRPVKSDLSGPLPVFSLCLRASSEAGGGSLLSGSKTLRPLRLCEKHSGSYPCHPWFSAPNPEHVSVLIRVISGQFRNFAIFCGEFSLNALLKARLP
jgi:hypothetical protein